MFSFMFLHSHTLEWGTCQHTSCLYVCAHASAVMYLDRSICTHGIEYRVHHTQWKSLGHSDQGEKTTISTMQHKETTMMMFTVHAVIRYTIVVISIPQDVMLSAWGLCKAGTSSSLSQAYTLLHILRGY